MSSPSRAYILIAYPISNAFREEVVRVAGGGVQFVLLAELRNLGIRHMLSFLRSMGRHSAIYIPLEDEHSQPLLPVLLAVAAVSSAQNAYVVRPGESLQPVTALQVVTALLGLVFGNLAGGWALLRIEYQARWLLRRRQTMVTPHDSNSILYINANLWFGVRAGGSVGHVAGVVNALADSGYEVHLASANRQVMLRDSVRQIALRAPRSFGFPPELNCFRYNYTALKQLRRIASWRRYGFLYQRMSVMNFVGVVLSRQWRVPLILEYNGSETWIAKNWGRPLLFSRIGLAIEEVCLRHAYRIVVVSRVLADELVQRGVAADRIVCYPNCVDPKHYSPELVPEKTVADIRARYAIPRDAVLVAFVGTFGQWHGAPVLADAIRQLVSYDSSWLRTNNVRFAMIGDGVMMKTIRQLIGGPEYLPWVAFSGLVPQAETVGYLAAADVLVSPHVRNADGSSFFGSPTKLFEYMAMQKGIIASDLDQIGEVLSAGIRIWQASDSHDGCLAQASDATAVLTRPGDVGDLIAAIKLLVMRPDLRNQFGRNARRELLERYTWSHHVARILSSLSPETQQEIADVALAASIR